MKKLLTFVALAASMFCAQAADVIDAAGLIAQNPGVTLSDPQPLGSTYDEDYIYGNDLTYTAESGLTYDLVNIALTEDYFRFWYNADLSSCLNGGSTDQWLESITIKCYNIERSQDVRIFASENEFDYTSWDGRDGADFQYKEYCYPNSKGEVVVKVNVPCRFFAMTVSQGNVESITVNWTDVKPVPTVENPVFECWDNPVEVGSRLDIKTSTTGATIHASVYINDVLAAEQPEPYVLANEWDSMSVTLPGKAGDVVKVEAYASKENWENSETTTWTSEPLAMAPAPRPNLVKVGSDSNWISYVIGGEQVEIQVNTNDENWNPVPVEGAKVKYSYGWIDYDDSDNSYETETVEADAPVIITVPEDAPVGLTFIVNAVAVVEGYRESEKMSNYIQIISNVLDTPTFSLEDGATVKAGGSLTINRPNNASEIHYTVNGGEEQVSDQWSVTIPVTEEITVEAWATGDAPFKPSDKVTVTVAPEKFEDWQDVITVSTFGVNEDNHLDTSFTMHKSVLTNANTGVQYEYKGGFYNRWVDSDYVDMFYFDSNNWQVFPFLRNTIPGVESTSNKPVPVKTVQIDSYEDRGFYLFLSNEMIELTEEMTVYGYEGTDVLRLTVAGGYNMGYDYPDNFGLKPGVMINLDEFQKENGDDEHVYNDKLYFTIAPVQASQSYYLERAIVGYNNNVTTGIGSVAADSLNGLDAIYNLNGVKVSADNLKPGVYVRVVDGKATKVVVK